MSRRGGSLVRAVALALAVVLLSPTSPLVLVGIPLAVFLLAFQGRSLGMVVLSGLLLVPLLFGVSTAASPLWFAERAWAFLLAGGFVCASLLLPGRSVLVRSIAAVMVACTGVAVFAALRPEAVGEVDWWVGTQLFRAVTVVYEWLGARAPEGLAETLHRAVRIQTALYPAFLGLASLAALSVAWHVMDRLRGGERSLAPLREFRFSDQLVWVLIGGLLLFLLPLGDLVERLGENAVAFMGGLYLLRGIAILVWLSAAAITSTWTAVVYALLAVLLYPVMVGAALLLGLGDTWLDLRRRLGGTSRRTGS